MMVPNGARSFCDRSEENVAKLKLRAFFRFGKSGICSSDQAGFALIELLVSLVLIGLLMAMVPATLKLARREQQVATQLDRRASFDAALAVVEQRLAETMAIYNRGADGRLHIVFQGDRETLMFMAPLAFRPQDAGVARFGLKMVTDGPEESGLLLTWTPWRPVRDMAEDGVSARETRRLIVPNATQLSLRYFGSALGADHAEWTQAWPRTDAIPDAVEFQVAVGDDIRVRRVVLRLHTP